MDPADISRDELLSTIPPEEISSRSSRKVFFTPRRITRMAIFISLSAVGAMIKIPSPTGTVSLDSCPGYFSAAAFGYLEGSIVAALGHLFTAFTIGFPLGLPVHLYIACQMALYVMVFRYLIKRFHPLVGIIIATLLNGVLSAYLIIPFGGIGLATALIIPLTIGSAVNIIIAHFAYSIVKKGDIVA
jgi:riboflavin transporter